jgi:type III secretory pathway component EscT
MTQRVSESLVAVLIRIGLLLALVILLMAENAQAQPLHVRALSISVLAGSDDSRTGNPKA